MIRLFTAEENPDPAAIAAAADILRAGGIVAYPTDTLYGLAVDPRRDDAVARLFEAKARRAELAMPLIAADLAQAEAAGIFGPRARRLAGAFWPGPLSIVVPARPAISRLALGGRPSVAVRVPASRVARALAERFGFPIAATSANPSGAPAAAAPRNIGEAMAGRIDCLLDGGAAPGGPPSTIVEIDETGQRLHREGAIAWERVLKSLI
jgi:L-threonylcarbamoyladenylate synthase